MSAWTTRGLRKVYSCHLTPLCVQEEVPKGDLHHGGSATSKGAAQQLPSRDAQKKRLHPPSEWSTEGDQDWSLCRLAEGGLSPALLVTETGLCQG